MEVLVPWETTRWQYVHNCLTVHSLSHFKAEALGILHHSRHYVILLLLSDDLDNCVLVISLCRWKHIALDVWFFWPNLWKHQIFHLKLIWKRKNTLNNMIIFIIIILRYLNSKIDTTIQKFGKKSLLFCICLIKIQ